MGVQDLLESERLHSERESNPTPVKHVDQAGAPVRNVVLTGEDADLTKLPLTHKCEHNAGRYISAGVTIMKERGTGAINMGMYRLQLQGPRQLGFMVNPANHGSHIHADYEEHGEPTPVAIVIGHHPAFYLSSVAKVPGPGGEMELCGSLMSEPLRSSRGRPWTCLCRPRGDRDRGLYPAREASVRRYFRRMARLLQHGRSAALYRGLGDNDAARRDLPGPVQRAPGAHDTRGDSADGLALPGDPRGLPTSGVSTCRGPAVAVRSATFRCTSAPRASRRRPPSRH